MPYGVGDLLASLGGGNQLNQDIASQITPNPNPLGQQGGGDGASQQAQQGLARPAVTQQDPTVGNLAAMLMRKSEMARAAEGFNRGTEEMASAFGTAQQQASKRAALGGGGGGANPLGDVSDIMKIQDAVTTQNEHASFMSHMDVLAKVLFPGDPDGIAKATEVAKNSGILSQFGQTAATNATLTLETKNVNEAVRSWADANPSATPADIQNYRSGLLSQGVGGLSGVGKELAEDRRNYMAVHPGATMAQMIADKPELADETSYVAIKGEKAKQTAMAGQEKQGAIDTFPSLDVSYQTAESKIEWLQAHPEAMAKAIRWGDAARGRVGQAAGAFGALDKDTADARGILDQLNDINFRGGMTNVKNVRSQIEALKIGGSVTNIDKVNNSDEQIRAESQRLFDIAHTARANLMGAAGKVIPARYTGLVDPSYLDPKSSVYNGATMEKIDFSKMSKADAERAYEALPAGTVFTGLDGTPMRKPW